MTLPSRRSSETRRTACSIVTGIQHKGHNGHKGKTYFFVEVLGVLGVLGVASPVVAGFEDDSRRERPLMAWTVDPDVVDPRLHAEGVEQPVVVVGEAVDFVDRDIELV